MSIEQNLQTCINSDYVTERKFGTVKQSNEYNCSKRRERGTRHKFICIEYIYVLMNTHTQKQNVRTKLSWVLYVSLTPVFGLEVAKCSSWF